MPSINELPREHYLMVARIAMKIGVQEYQALRALGHPATEAADIAIAAIADFKGIVECHR